MEQESVLNITVVQHCHVTRHPEDARFAQSPNRKHSHSFATFEASGILILLELPLPIPFPVSVSIIISWGVEKFLTTSVAE